MSVALFELLIDDLEETTEERIRGIDQAVDGCRPPNSPSQGAWKMMNRLEENAVFVILVAAIVFATVRAIVSASNLIF